MVKIIKQIFLYGFLLFVVGCSKNITPNTDILVNIAGKQINDIKQEVKQLNKDMDIKTFETAKKKLEIDIDNISNMLTSIKQSCKAEVIIEKQKTTKWKRHFIYLLLFIIGGIFIRRKL